MKKNILLAALLLFCSAGILPAGDKVEFNAEELSNPEIAAKKYTAGGNLKLLKKHNVKKVVILECTGEFVTSKDVERAVWDSSLYTAKFNNDFYTNVTDIVYEELVKLFEKHGIEVVRKEVLMNSPTYQEWNLKEEKEGRGVTGGIYKNTVVTKTQKVATTGLGVFPGPIGMLKVFGDLAPITQELGADSMLQVQFKVDQNKKMAPILVHFNVVLNTDLRSREGGFKGNKKTYWDFYVQNTNMISISKSIESKTNFAKNAKEFDTKGYVSELSTMLLGSINGWDVLMGKALPDNKPIVREAVPAEPAQPAAESAPAAPN